MNLQTRTLRRTMRGHDVALLQYELTLLGFDVAEDPSGDFGPATLRAVREFQRQRELEPTGVVDTETARLINAAVDALENPLFLVRGVVRRADGALLLGATVQVLRRQLRREETLGQVVTDESGRYAVEYRPGDEPVTIVVRAHARGHDEPVESPPICPARPLEIVDVTFGGAFRGPSEFTQLSRRLAPILQAEGVATVDLEVPDVELLACAHDLNAEHVAYFVVSARMAREADVSAEAFYALVRQGLPTVLIALVAQPPEMLRRAIETSVRENIVGAQLGEDEAIARILRGLHGQIVRLALREPEPDRISFGALLEIAGVPEERGQPIVTAYLDHDGTTEEFWQRLREQGGIDDEEIEAIQYTVGAAAIALNHRPLIRELALMRRAGEVGQHLHDLASFDLDGWRSLVERNVDGARIGAPGMLGESEELRTARYVEFLPRMVETIFPTAVLAHHLAETDGETFAPTIAFLSRNPELDFRTMRLDDFLREHPDALDGGDDPETMLAQLHAVQRMFAIAPPFNKVATIVLIAEGIDSAVAIRRMGAPQFIRTKAAALGGVMAAQQVYSRAALRADAALSLLSQSVQFNPTPLAITAPHLFGQGVPDLEDLFGSLDLCQCEHCASVYSPAAYLVDILHYLMNRPAESPGRTALDVLFDRRGDIGDIELTCHNTNTVLPYVDLINEILEDAVAPGGGFPFQTEADSDILGANPEHLNEAAYNVLAQDAIYPWSLPFDLWAEEARYYLDQLGVPRHALMEHFRREGVAPLPIDVAAEYLGLTLRECAIITGDTTETTREMWGMSQAEFSQLLADRRASLVLERSGLSYEDLTALLEVELVNPTGTLHVQFAGADCNLDTATVDGLTTAALDRLHRFVRLQRKLGWPVHELGLILETLGASDLDDDTLRQLVRVKHMRDELKTLLETMISWWSWRLDTQGRDGELSPYERVFLDPTVNRPELQIFALDNTRLELDDPAQSIGAHAAVVHGVLGISADDLELLVAEELPDDRLNLANLTRLYQAVTLAKALKLPIGDYVALRALTGIDPFGVGAVAVTERFIEQTRLVQESGFDVAALDYLLRHQAASAPQVPSEEQIGEFLGKLRAALWQIAADHEFASDPTGVRTAETLALILPGEIVNRAVALIDVSSTEDQASQAALIEEHFALFLDPDEAIERLIDPGTLETPEERFDYVLEPLLAHLARIAVESLVIESLAGALGVDSTVAEQLLRELVAAPGDAGQPILEVFMDADFLAAGVGEQDTAVTPPTPDEFPEQFAAFHRLAKVAILLDALDVPAERVDFLLTNAAELGWIDPNELPLEATEAGVELFEVWAATVILFRAASGLPDGVTALFDLLAGLDEPGLTRDAFLDLVAERTGWRRGDLDFLTGPDGFDLQFPAGFDDGQFIARLKRCSDLLKILDVSADAAWSWATPEMSAALARTIKQAARAKFDDQQQWLAVTLPIRDELREQQRAALVAFLVHAIRVEIPMFEPSHPTLSIGDRREAVKELQHKLNAAGANPPLKVDGIFGPLTRAAVVAFQEANDLDPDGIVGPITWAALDQVRGQLRGPNDLYAHFLIDVEMDPCMLTSRLVQATNSVQLFVQRCLLNLEPGVVLTPEDSKEWDWMKNYRVWEANRKVFLYPENWIEPELRDDKSPFFKDLENGLLQDEITQATVERGYLQYLKALDGVAQMEISGLYREWEEDRDILHVIARTHNTPHIYHHRQWVDQRYWTPWEHVEADVEGDHLMPVVWNRRLYLFWPMFIEKAEEAITDGAQPPRRYYEIRQAWSEYRDGEWSPKRLSNNFFSTPPSHILTDRAEFSIWAQFDNEGLYILSGRNYSLQSHQPIYQQFRLAQCDGALEVNHWHDLQESWEGFPSIPHKWPKPFLGTHHYYNALVPFHYVDKLSAITGGHLNRFSEDVQDGPTEFEFEMLEESTDENVLFKTPGSFRVMLPNVDRPFISRSPFFYQDSSRNFLVVPRGIYTGGVDSGVLGDFTLELQPLNAVPLELPDIVTTLATNFVRRHSTADTDGAVSDELRAPGSSDLVAMEPGTGHTLAAILTPVSSTVHVALPKQWEAKFFRFENFYHPYACLLIEQLNRHGIDGVLRPDPEQELPSRRELVAGLRRQQLSEAFFNAEYEPNDENVVNVYKLSEEEKEAAGPVEEFDFAYGGPYSVYNWELFFHAPLMLAKRLSANRRFAEAQRWFHYIFDPTYALGPDQASDESWPERVWQIKPFFEHGVGKAIQRTMLLLKSAGLNAEEQAERKQLRDQIEAWRKNPFNPHLIARMRVEPYMKAVVMAYLDNLIAWGDHLFRQDTRESINEATQLYILAAEVLGERPQEIPAHEGARKTIDGEEVKTFNQLKDRLDDFSNVLVELESTVYPMDTGTGGPGGIGGIVAAADLALNTGGDDGGFAPDLLLAAPDVEPPDDGGGMVLDLPLATPIPAILGPTLFFCIPKNAKLLGYWDSVADRLFKIRHCMNIEGVVRQLPLFQPPIDPGLLVKAAAAGLDIGSVLSDLNAPPPHYRFQALAQKANEFINDVKTLGAALLSTLEKKDAEELALLRSTHEIQVLEAIRHAKDSAVQEAQESKRALEETRKVTEARHDYYSSRPRTNDKEEQHLEKLEQAHTAQLASQGLELVGAILASVPNFDLGIEGAASSPTVKASWGGSNLAASMQAYGRVASLFASIHGHQATKASIEGGYDRRQDDWNHQADLADKELGQIDKQIDAADIRIAIAEQDLQNHDLQIVNAKAVDEYMRGKYTNPELYGWMIGQVSAIYFQSYQLAYDMAKGAERAFRHELGAADTDFISFGYWDSLKKGLLSGEKLQYDLRRMEAAYLEQNRREYELTKHVSLALLDPIALLQLRESGQCSVNLPEAIFDLDCPGHFNRRIKSVSLTIPCVAGPYTSVNCTLTLLGNRVRVDSTAAQPYSYDGLDDPRFRHNTGAIQSIATSSGQNDAGLFELNFRDERYLPFEGAGAISTWRLELPTEFRQFDYDTISDVILHMRYTAREGGGALRQAAVASLQEEALNALPLGQNGERTGLFQFFSARRFFSSDWHRFLNPPEDASPTLQLDLARGRFPYWLQALPITVTAAQLYLKLREGADYDNANPVVLDLSRAGETSPTLAEVELLLSGSPIAGLPHARRTDWPDDGLGAWAVSAQPNPALSAEVLEDFWLVLEVSLVA